MKQSHSSILKIIGIYIVFGSLWIYFSDTVVGWIIKDPVIVTRIAITKGVLFIGCTAVLLYVLIRRHVYRLMRADRLLLEQKDLLHNITANIPGVVYEFYAAGNGEFGVNYVSEQLEQVFGLSGDRDQFFLRFTDHVMEDDRQRFLDSVREAVSAGGPWNFEGRFVRPSGEVLWFQGIATSKNEGGRLLYHGVLLDITGRKELEQKRIQSEQLLHAILAASPIGIGKVRDRTIVWANETLCRLSGYTLDDLQGKNVSLFYENERLSEATGKLLYEEGRAETRMVRKDGIVRDVLIQISPTDSYSYVFSIVDITEQKRSEDELRTSEQRFRALFDLAPFACVLTDLEGRYVLVNEAFTSISGYSTSEAMGRTPLELGLIPENHSPHVFMAELAEKGKVHNIEMKTRTKTGEEKYLVFSSRLVDVESSPLILTITIDITEHRRAEQALRESESKFRVLAEKSVVGIYLIQDGIFKYVNEKLAQVVGYTVDEMINGMTVETAIHPEDWPLVRENLRKRMAGELESIHYEFKVCTKTGEVRDTEVYSSLTFYQGRPAVLGTLLDITERKTMESVLRNSEERLQALFESAGDAIVISKEVIVDCNEKTLTMFGTSREHFIGKILYNYSPALQPDGRNSIEEGAKKVRLCFEGTPQFFEWKHCREDGTPFDAEVSLTKINIRGEMYFQTIVRDISVRKTTEEELMRLSTAIEQSAEEVIITDPDGVIQYVNPAFEKITGYSRHEAIGKTPRILKSGVHDDAFYQDLWNTITGGNVWIGQLTNRRKDGALIHEDATITPLINPSSQLTGYVSLKRDITREVKLHSQLAQAQKMEAIGTLAGSIAHDFNNILTVITGYATLAQMKTDKENPLRAHVDQILAASRKAADLTRSLLTFSRQQPVALVPLDITTVVKETEKLLKRLLTEDIELLTSLTDEEIIVMADKTKIDQILFNLVTNARDAMPRGGTLTVETACANLDDSFAKIHGFGEPGRYALINVSDMGTGMDETTREKIFEPFFTTKETGKGTGLGLATVYGIVRQHNGYITVDSAPGKGTTFHIFLPVVATKVHEATDVETPVQTGKETILIAEDNKEVRNFMREVLQQHGYRTIETIDGDDAITTFKKHGDIDLVILDTVMPKKNGREAYDAIQAIKPHTKTLFTSGYTKDIILDKGIEETEFNFIAKPLTIVTFLRKVREVLDRE